MSLKDVLTLCNRQDLNCSILTGSKRFFCHTTFSELCWKRDEFIRSSMPAGFVRVSRLLPEEIQPLLEDIHSLQRIRDSSRSDSADIVSLLHFDNQLASVLSRLSYLPTPTPFLEALYRAVYLTTCMICCRIWQSTIVPVSFYLQRFGW